MEALSSSTDVFEDFFESARIGLALADLSGSYVRVNSTYAELVGRAPEDLVGVPLSEVLPDSDVAALSALAAGRSEAVSTEQSHEREGGSVVWVLHGIAVVLGADGTPAWYAVSAQDITERRQAEKLLEDRAAESAERALRDPLTELANRVLFEERLRGALALDARNGGSTGVLFLDLDGFKEINDEHGHNVGDVVLRNVAGRLVNAVRPADTVARLGGDEFVVLVEDATEAGLDALVPRLVAAVEAPQSVLGLTLQVGVSVGRALAAEGAADPAGLVSAADAQMYAVKRRRR